MDENKLKAYAQEARREFLTAVADRAAFHGLTANGIELAVEQGDVVLIGTRAFSQDVATKRKDLEERVRRDGFQQTMEATAYTWFNRFAAIRYMELHGYLDHGYRVLSHPAGHEQPEVLDHAADVELPGLDHDKAVDLKLDGTKDEELYQLLFLAQCNALHQAMPFLFERIGDATELLLPDNLLHIDSVMRRLVNVIDEGDWNEIEIIGWLYQFYISEKKDEVIGKVLKSEDIPAATQLFTPNWIVKYMVQNSLGAQWLATYPQSPLKEQMDYYIEPAEQTDEVKAQLRAITPDSLNPEELTLIDPACGSGHILVEAYDLFKSIYLERGYRQRDVPQLILENNLFGLDIDERAAQLTGFALMMTGRADDRRLFERDVNLNVMTLVDSTDFDAARLSEEVKLADHGLQSRDLAELKRLFEHTSTFGSLIRVPDDLVAKLSELKQLSEVTGQYLFVSDALKVMGQLVRQANLLTMQHDEVIANPPYIGNKFHTPVLRKFLKDQYNGYEKDVFSAFIDRGFAFCKPRGRLGLMSPFVWMFISSHEYLRKRLIYRETITSLVQLEYSGFASATVPICTFTLQKNHLDGQRGCYIRLSDFRGPDIQGPRTIEAIRRRDCGWMFEAAQDEFGKIPGSPIAYWASRDLQRSFEEFESLHTIATPRAGMITGDNANFVRLWWEVSYSRTGIGYFSRSEAKSSKKRWFPYQKGGRFRKWFGNREYIVDWENDGHRLRTTRGHRGTIPAHAFNEKFIFQANINWSTVSSSLFSARVTENGFLFDSAGSAVFPGNVKTSSFIAAFLNSKITCSLLGAINPTLNFQAWDIGNLPLDISLLDSVLLSGITHRLHEIAKSDWNAYERSWDFTSLPILATLPNFEQAIELTYNALIGRNRQYIAEMKRLEEENNRLFIDAYALQEELTPEVPIEQITLTINPAYRYGGKLTEDEQWTRFREDTMRELVSYTIGCMMGRYSLDEPGLIYAHSDKASFDANRYVTFAADDDGIIPVTHGQWFNDDAAHRQFEFISTAWGASHLEGNLTFLAHNLSPRRNESSRDTIRRYLCDSFFKDHLQTYKRRPVYWLFSSGKAKAFQCLMYLHRYNEGTLARMRTEYVVPLQGMMASRVRHLDGDITAATSTARRKRLDKERTTLVRQQSELREFDEKLRHYADQQISLDLDDGVKLNYGKFGDLLAEVKKVTGGKAD